VLLICEVVCRPAEALGRQPLHWCLVVAWLICMLMTSWYVVIAVCFLLPCLTFDVTSNRKC